MGGGFPTYIYNLRKLHETASGLPASVSFCQLREFDHPAASVDGSLDPTVTKTSVFQLEDLPGLNWIRASPILRAENRAASCAGLST